MDTERESVSSRTRNGKKKKDEEDEDDIDDVLAEYLDDPGDVDEPEDGEDLYGSDIEKDYLANETLDTYEIDGMDDVN